MASGLEPIAIVGSSCRFPGGARSPSKLWDLLKEPYDLSTEIPSTRFDTRGFYQAEATHHGSTNVTQAYVLQDDPRTFDHNFFGIHRKEAESMDPQQRILLEVVYECIESAGYSMWNMKGSSTGVFVGQMSADYYDMLLRDIDCAPQYMGTGTSRAIMANRISYFFGWQGPSMNIDTACSSSLVALHQAVQSLRKGESQAAIVAGVNLILGPEMFIIESNLHMLSPTGRSRMWDSDADGYARGEGFAAVIVKTLRQALADNDHIECIIRETGVNQDGHTSGLTVPSEASQSQLIKTVYERCGLDYRRKEDRCQYFEAHGTGTAAGDPKEAAAIQNVFFPEDEKNDTTPSDDVLYVGSVKTVIGHLEGTAGLAGLVKASLAVQHAVIPPNLHFNQLNPTIEPFYKHLRIPTKDLPWPERAPGEPRRASVNSFGFGGTNAHVILESYESQVYMTGLVSGGQEPDRSPGHHEALHGPFLLSADSGSSLCAAVASLYEILKDVADVNLGDMAWTLQTRRTELPFKVAFSAINKDQLMGKLGYFLENQKRPHPYIFSRSIEISPNYPLRILGVFTGQGAQWLSMGARLYSHSSHFKNSIQNLEESLKSLPDAPSWSLSEELRACEEMSRVHNAEFSQPLTTALQIALVDLLKVSGISFSAVVGHSSGEIAAVYTAGYLKAADAIRVAYYRGLHLSLARSSTSQGQSGKMMAVKMSLEEAQAFCENEHFTHKIEVAANNSKSNVTLSGDADSIDEAKGLFDKRGMFARILKVDKAYHSHHMEPCTTPFLESLNRCDIQLARTDLHGDCKWYSSVYGSDGRVMNDPVDFRGKYWVQNMRRPVLFAHAIERAVREENCFDIVLEVGPHPTLKGPVHDSLSVLTGIKIPYHGVLKRGENDLNAFSDALGFVWGSVQPAYIPNFAALHEACRPKGSRKPRVQKGLPTYNWDHDEVLLFESRKSRIWRERKQPIHELLGTSSQNAREMRWRHIMRLGEMEWLKGHQFQNQVLFPAAGYISMAYEAAIRITDHRPISLVELYDLVIHHAITLEDGSFGTEVNFTIQVIHRDDERITAEYFCCTNPVNGLSSDPEQTNFTGKVTVQLGIPSHEILPTRVPHKLPLTDINVDRFYESILRCGLRYSPPFIVDSVRRRQNLSTVTITQIPDSKFRVHPATLDAAFHGLFAAFSFPGDGRLQNPYLPNRISRVRISMACPEVEPRQSVKLVADCFLRDASLRLIGGDVDVFCAEKGHPIVQIQGLQCSSIPTPESASDVPMFAHTVWKRDIRYGLEWEDGFKTSDEDRELYEISERTAYFFFRQLRQIEPDEIDSMDWHFQRLMTWVLNRLLPRIEAGNHPRINPEWSNDGRELIMQWKGKYAGHINMQIIHAVGDALLSIVRGTSPILEVLMENEMLSRFYKNGLGMPQANKRLAALATGLSHRYPHMNILEIGAGSGGATAVVLESLDASFDSYTFTDISAGFFNTAQNTFAKHGSKMRYRTLDIEKSPHDQGFEDKYDLIIASNVVHATRSLSETLKNCRSIMKSGGYLLLLEISSEALWPQFIVSGLPGWWLGADNGRPDHPTISEEEWDSVLRETGFFGVENAYRDFEDSSKYTISVMSSQAMDDGVAHLRNPTAVHDTMAQVEGIIIVAGTATWVTGIAVHIEKLLRPFATNITLIRSLEDVDNTMIDSGGKVICLADLDEPVFKCIDLKKFHGIQTIFTTAKYILWVTQGCRADDPYASMIVGMGRSIMMEDPNIRLKFVDTDRLQGTQKAPEILCEIFLQMIHSGRPEYANILWSEETEVEIKDGSIYIPRIIPDEVLNIRFHEMRKEFHHQKSISFASSNVRLTNHDGFLKLQAMGDIDTHTQRDSYPMLHVETSSLFPIHTSDNKSFHLCIATINKSDQKALLMYPDNCSQISGPDDQKIEYGEADGIVLQQVLAILVCENLAMGITGTLWVHNASFLVEEVISDIAARNGFQLFSSVSSGTNDKATFLHPNITTRALMQTIPPNIQRVAVWGSESFTSVEDALKSHQDYNVDIQFMDGHKEHLREIPLHFESNQVLEIIKKGFSTRSDTASLENLPYEIPIRVDALPQQSRKWNTMSIIDWTTSASLQVQEISRYLFSRQKTYWLIGLAGGVGLSLCEWMVDNGARNFAISSRNPKIDPETLAHLRSKGAIIKILSLDVANKQALHQAYQEIKSSMPPITGIANGAMVLRDRQFENISLEDFDAVLCPKVSGSKNLDELFYSDDLEFFILFSSLNRTIGNPAQSNYAAANMFMSTLAAQRRKRGVAASVIDIPMLLGVGYLTRATEERGSSIQSHLRQYEYLAISEADLHLIFHEAVLSGRPDSGLNPELIAGLGRHPSAPWSRIPRFGHFTSGSHTTTKPSDGQYLYDNLRAKLTITHDIHEKRKIIEASFSRKLSLFLQVSIEKIDVNSPLTELGIDSLVAVEIRSWFLKELEVDIPVLRVLNGASITDICRDATENLPGIPRANISAQPNKAALGSHLQTAMPKLQSLSPEKFTAESQASEKAVYERSGRMSHAQERLYFLHRYLEDSSSSNVVYFGQIRGELSVEKFEMAFYNVAKNHESLRSSYFIDKALNQGIQAVQPEPYPVVDRYDIQTDDEVQHFVKSLKETKFDIEQGHTMRIALLSPKKQRHRHLIISHHHIVLDGFSWVRFIRDIVKSYNGEKLTPPIRQSIDLSESRRSLYRPENLQYELRFWSQLHQNPSRTLPLFPFSKTKTREILKAYDTQTFEMRLDPALSAIVKKRATKLGSTSFNVYLSALAAMISRCLDVYDFNIGIMDANRTELNDEEVVGYFLNALPLRFCIDQDDPFDKIVKQSRDAVLAALAHSCVPFDMILDHLGVSRHGTYHPLFQIALNYRMGVQLQTPIRDGEIEWSGSIPASSPYDLTIDITETNTVTLLAITSHKYMYESGDTKLLMKWYIRALEGLVIHPSTKVSNCPIANESDMVQMSELIQGTDIDISWTGTLVDQVERMASQYPLSPAVKDSHGHWLSYTQLMSRSQEIAYQLRSRSVTEGSCIAMLLNPTSDAICCLLAVLWLGLIWVPLDLRNPRERLLAILTDCTPNALVCNNETKALATELVTDGLHVINLDFQVTINTANVIRNSSERSQPAVILYTSGSTGVPKGVLLTHENILNQIFVNTTLYGIGREVVLQQTSLGFDLALDQIFHALANGGTLIVVSKEGRGDPTHIANLMLSERVTYTLLVPTEYLSLFHFEVDTLRKCRSWRFAFSGGEKISPQMRQFFRKLSIPRLLLINLYGPTEATIGCARGIVPYNTDDADEPPSDSDSLWPMPNYLVAVMDNRMQLAPVGFPGEICIAGPGLSLGYINRPEETKSRFANTTMMSLSKSRCNRSSLTFYRSGDMGRIMEDGSLGLLGRLGGDSQVKVRGIRVELDDISSVIIKAARGVITAAAVSLRHDHEVLAAFVVFDGNFLGSKTEFGEQLKTELPLPSYMIPTFIVPIENLPTNFHGKLDRSAIDGLPLPEVTARVYSEEFKNTEKRMKTVWQKVLTHTKTNQLVNIGLTSDFFHIGGNSILLIKLRSVIQETFDVSVSLSDLFQSSTLRSMAARVKNHNSNESALSPVLVDYDAEVTELSCDLRKPRVAATARTQSSLVVILTGATGFLGTHILQQLVKDERVREIHCVAVRPDDLGNGRRIRVESEKIIKYSGDLSDKFLGLSNTDFRLLADRADLVIHNGADVSFMKTYHSLRNSNVFSTRALCDLVIPRGLPFHFVSSASVSIFASSSVLSEVSLAQQPPPPDTRDGYTASKWVSEVLLERSSKDCGFPVWIHRPTTVIGDDAPESDIISVLLKYSRLIRAVPAMPNERFKGSLNLVQVENVSQDLVQIALGSVCGDHQPETRFLHHCSDVNLAPSRLKQYIEETHGGPIRTIQMREWLELAQDAGIDELVYSYLLKIVERESKVVLPSIVK
ncbi:hybrid PKS-NRPS PsoA [Xylariaceae sp. FL0662B]|nr:hybrid PKS-NRPS PsoA [Xylariaceae sp. FL0662B]